MSEAKERYYRLFEQQLNYNPVLGCKTASKYIEELEQNEKGMLDALIGIASEKEVHTKLNQERLCCKFQDIAIRAIEELKGKPIDEVLESAKCHLIDVGDGIEKYAEENSKKELEEYLKKR